MTCTPLCLADSIQLILELYISELCVTFPDMVRVEVLETRGTLTVDIFAHSEDKGKIIGINGRHIKPMRAIVNALTDRHKLELNHVNLADCEEPQQNDCMPRTFRVIDRHTGSIREVAIA